MTHKIRVIVAAWLLSAIVLTACQSARKMGTEVTVEGGSYRVVSVSELQTMLKNKDFVMANVHIPWQGDIPQTDLRVAYDQIEQAQGQFPPEKGAKVLVYCLTSGMAKTAAKSLVDLGYTNVWMLAGGTTAWEEAGLAIEKK